ncbi:hypothetical protein SAOR_03025 [Salinisphaera orenii MK-B5]|uniref:Uncharacterized protein n=2 Tax=Salinisphaera TaxID=180541 RepID=A0A423PVX7_9GAMM|nr:hypothetical protein SAOR_03025 [Salinisphaera orenii MK-B5]
MMACRRGRAASTPEAAAIGVSGLSGWHHVCFDDRSDGILDPYRRIVALARDHATITR